MTIKQVVRNYRNTVGDKQFYQELVILPVMFLGMYAVAAGFAAGF